MGYAAPVLMHSFPGVRRGGLLVFTWRPKADFNLLRRHGRRSKQLPYGIEDDFKVVVVFTLHGVDFALEIDDAHADTAQLHECPHDVEINVYRDIAI